jgi:WD40 repeat protein
VSSGLWPAVVAAAAPLTLAGAPVGPGMILPTAASPPRTSARKDAFGDLLPSGAVARLGTIRFRHAGRAECLSFSPDGRMLVSSNGYQSQSWHAMNGGSYQAQFWDLTTGKLVRRISAESVHFLPSGSRIIVYRDRQIRAWDMAGGKQLWSVPHQGSVQVSPDGTKVFAVPIDDSNDPRGLRVLEAGSGKEIRSLETPSVDACAHSPDGLLYAGTNIEHPERRAGAKGGKAPFSVVQIWNVETGKQIARIELVKAERHRICFSPDGRSLIIMEKEKYVPVDRQMCTLFHIWNVAEGREVAVHKVWGGFYELAVSPDGETVVIASYDGQIDVRRFADWKLIRKLVGHLDASTGFPALAFSPDGDMLAVSVPGAGPKTVQRGLARVEADVITCRIGRPGGPRRPRPTDLETDDTETYLFILRRLLPLR